MTEEISWVSVMLNTFSTAHLMTRLQIEPDVCVWKYLKYFRWEYELHRHLGFDMVVQHEHCSVDFGG